MTVASVSRHRRSPPPMDVPVTVKATSNDPGQRVSQLGSDTVKIAGKATNSGFVPSFVRLQFDGKTVSVSPGGTASHTLQKIRDALPAGYAVKALPTIRDDGSVMFRIVRAAPGKNDPAAISADFARALRPDSRAKGDLNVVELRSIVKRALKDGFTAAEKDALARKWSSTFDGSRFRATDAAKAEYAKLQKAYNLPVYPVR
jgi:hypothetical protein